MPSSNGSLRERIRASEAPTRLLEVDGWDVTVEIRSMSVAEKFGLFGDDDEITLARTGQMMPDVILLTCFDPETGDKLFTDEDREWLADAPAGPIETVAMAGLSLSGVDQDAIDAGKGDSS
jgi:hypothetical protein